MAAGAAEGSGVERVGAVGEETRGEVGGWEGVWRGAGSERSGAGAEGKGEGGGRGESVWVMGVRVV